MSAIRTFCLENRTKFSSDFRQSAPPLQYDPVGKTGGSFFLSQFLKFLFFKLRNVFVFYCFRFEIQQGVNLGQTVISFKYANSL